MHSFDFRLAICLVEICAEEQSLQHPICPIVLAVLGRRKKRKFPLEYSLTEPLLIADK